jgi:hypothetical protein
MIRVKCPKCEKMLGMDDAKAGTLAGCPACGAKFRVPGEKASVQAAAKTKPGGKKIVKKVKKPDKTKRPWGGDEPDDFTPYVVAPASGPDRPPDTSDADTMARHAERQQERNRAWREVGFPAKLMKIMGISMCVILFLAFAYVTVSIVLYVHQTAMFQAAGAREGQGVFKPKPLPPINQIVPQHLTAGGMEAISAGVLIFGLLYFGFIIAGAEKMKRLEGYGLAMTASILSLVTFLPVGAVAIMALLKEEVKREFPGGKPAQDEEEELEDEDEDDEEFDDDDDEDEDE